MKVKDNLIIFSGLILLLNLLLNVFFNIIFLNPGKIYSNFIEPIFYIIATFLLVRKWSLKGLVSILIIYLIPLGLLIMVSLLEYGINMFYKVMSTPIIYQSRQYCLVGIMLGFIINLILEQVFIKKRCKG